MKFTKVQYVCLAMAAFLFADVYAEQTSSANQRMEYLDNGVVRIGYYVYNGGMEESAELFRHKETGEIYREVESYRRKQI